MHISTCGSLTRSEVGVVVEGQLSISIVARFLLDSSLLILADSLLEEVGLALQRDHVHPLEGVLDVVLLGDAEGRQQSV